MAQEAQAKKKAALKLPNPADLTLEKVLATVLENNPKLTREEAIAMLKEAGVG